jgi:hypothetical protein
MGGEEFGPIRVEKLEVSKDHSFANKPFKGEWCEDLNSSQ